MQCALIFRMDIPEAVMFSEDRNGIFGLVQETVAALEVQHGYSNAVPVFMVAHQCLLPAGDPPVFLFGVSQGDNGMDFLVLGNAKPFGNPQVPLDGFDGKSDEAGPQPHGV